MKPQVAFSPPFTNGMPLGAKRTTTTGFGPATAYHQQRTAGCNSAPGSHSRGALACSISAIVCSDFRQKLRIPKVPSFHLRPFNEVASTRNNNNQQTSGRSRYCVHAHSNGL